jgi:ubiquitin-protein ligase
MMAFEDWRSDELDIRVHVEDEIHELTISPFDEVDDVLDELCAKTKRLDLGGLAKGDPRSDLPACLAFQNHRPGDEYYASVDPNPMRFRLRFVVPGTAARLKVVVVSPRRRFSALVGLLEPNSAAPPKKIIGVFVKDRLFRLDVLIASVLGELRDIAEVSPSFDPVAPPRPVARVGPPDADHSPYTLLHYNGIAPGEFEPRAQTLDAFFSALEVVVRANRCFTRAVPVSFLFFSDTGFRIPGGAMANALGGRNPRYVLGYAGRAVSDDVAWPRGKLPARETKGNLFGDSPGLLDCYLAYLRLDGPESRALVRALTRFIDFPPFFVSLHRVVKGADVTEADIVVIRECLRCYIAWQLGKPLQDCLASIGIVFSNLLREVRALDRPSDWPVGDDGAWKAVGVAGGCRRLPANVDKPSRGPFDPVPQYALSGRTTLTVVAHPDTALLLGRHPETGHSVLWKGYRVVDDDRPLPNARIWDLIVPPEITQVTVILVDCSGTMTSVTPALKTRKIKAAESFVRKFWEAAHQYRPAAIFGFGHFPANDFAIDFTFLPPAEGPKLTASGHGSIWQALLDTANELERIPGNTMRRIILITDGEDEISDARLDVCNRLLQLNIVLDAIVLANRDVQTKLEALEEQFLHSVCPICSLTGGAAFCPKTQDPEFLYSESFVDMSLRRIEKKLNNNADILDFNIIALWEPRFANQPIFKRPFEQNQGLQLAVSDPRTARETRIADEFRICREAKGQDYYFEKKIDHWRVFMRIPGAQKIGNDDPLWDLAVTFPAEYPHALPLFRFITVPKNLNVVSEFGLINTSRVRAIYHPAMTVVSLLREVVGGLAGRARYRAGWDSEGEPKVIPDIHCIRLLSSGNPRPYQDKAPTPGEKASDLRYSTISWKRIGGMSEPAADFHGFPITQAEAALLSPP